MSAEIILLAKYVLATLAGVPTTLAGIHHNHPVANKDLLLVVAFVAALSPAACSNCLLCSLPVTKKQHATSELSLSLC
jgi:hypothetical protein